MNARTYAALCAAALVALPAARQAPARAAQRSAASQSSAGEKAATGPTTLLDAGSFWRFHFTWRAVRVRRKSGGLELVSVKWPSRGPAKLTPAGREAPSPPAPENWRQCDFDDSAWPRAQGPMFTRSTRRLALLCARGKFQVADPARAGALELSLAYRGGAVVYVNGREVARGHLPAGRIDPETPAEDYPPEAYLAPTGYLLRHAFGEPKKYPDRYALRKRSLAARVPASLLRKGTNVLAVELHRAPVSEVFYVSKFRDSRKYFLWDMVALEDVRLAAEGTREIVFHGTAGGIVPSPDEVAQKIREILGG